MLRTFVTESYQVLIDPAFLSPLLTRVYVGKENKPLGTF